jgi:hypothetical protein
MLFGLFAVDAVIALTTLLFFGLMGFVLHKFMSVKAHKLGYLVSEFNVASDEKIIEVIDCWVSFTAKNNILICVEIRN